MNYEGNSEKELLSKKAEPCRVYIISGFLGSGKTTLLQLLLDWELNHDRRPCVIMSEFGDIDIDGVLVSDHRIALTSIAGGCACCDLRDELARSLLEVTRQKPGCTIFLESTGIADPAGILIAIEPLIRSGSAVVRNIVVVYDAARHPLLGVDRELVKNQLIAADTIMINKSDLTSAIKIEEIKINIAEVNAGAELIATSNCLIEPAKILEKKSAFKIPVSTGTTSKPFRSYGLQIDSPLSKTRLQKWLNTLPPSVVRVKGFVRLQDQRGFYEIQSVFGQSSIMAFDKTENPPSMLVLVTHPIRTDGLVKRLQDCVIDVNNSERKSGERPRKSRRLKKEKKQHGIPGKNLNMC
jgi:G3E family GTPase